MIDPANIPSVADDELLARFIVNRNEVRADGTVRPQLLLPYRHVTLPVNRHRDTDPQNKALSPECRRNADRPAFWRTRLLKESVAFLAVGVAVTVAAVGLLFEVAGVGRAVDFTRDRAGELLDLAQVLV